MKKPFILFLGVGWSGTTSLYYTLHKNINYVHGGFLKESEYLPRYYPIVRKNMRKYLLEMNYQCFVNFSQKISSKNIDDHVLSKYSELELFSFFGPNLSLQKYLNYYLSLAKYSNGKYVAVGDFSNNNWSMNKNQMSEVKHLLKDHFDIKVICIFRDLVRRQWSHRCAFDTSNINSLFVINSKHSGKKVMRPLTTGPIIDVIQNLPVFDYAEKVSIAYDIFGKENVCYLIMEDFFKNEKNNPEVIKLEKFLNIKIPLDRIYPCNYVPDRGINPPKVGDLPDQWTSDHQILTPQSYNTIRNMEDYARSYSKFEKFHGCLPADWGEPIDYRY